jgi:outer membrane lipoprotein-sorting protein
MRLKKKHKGRYCKMLMLSVLLNSFALAHITYAQDFSTVLKDIQQDLKNANSLHIVMNITAYEGQNSLQPYYTEKVILKKKGNNLIYRLTDYDMLYNDKYYINVNRQFKIIRCVERTNNAAPENERTPDIDSLLSFVGNPVPVSRDGDILQFSISNEGFDIQKTDIFIDKKENKILELVYHYDESKYPSGQLVKISFEKFEVNTAIENNEFNTDQYVVHSGTGFMPTEAYSGYQISLGQ